METLKLQRVTRYFGYRPAGMESVFYGFETIK